MKKVRKIVLPILLVVDFFYAGIICSLQGPLYPEEAKEKGATPSEVHETTHSMKMFKQTFFSSKRSMDSLLDCSIWLGSWLHHSLVLL